MVMISFTTAQGGIKVYAQGGFNYADIGGENADNPGKIAPHLGGYLQLMFTDVIGVQPAVLVSFQGHGEEEVSLNKLKTSYVNVPVMFRYNVGYNGHVLVGPQFGILLSAKSEFVDPFSGASSEVDVKDQFKGSDLSLVFGGGLDIMDRFNASIRYALGLSDLNETEIPGNKRTNQVIQVSFAIKLLEIDN